VNSSDCNASVLLEIWRWPKTSHLSSKNLLQNPVDGRAIRTSQEDAEKRGGKGIQHPELTEDK